VAGRRDPLTAITERWGAAAYIVMLLGTEVLTMLVRTLGSSLDGGQVILRLAAYATGMVLAVFLWRQAPSRLPARGLLRVFLVLALALWVLEAGRRWMAGAWLNPIWLAVPLLVVLLWRKPPNRAEATAAVTGVAVAFMGVVLAALVLERAGMTRDLYVNMESLREFDLVNYWLPLSDLLGVDGRWAGPFPHPNHAGPVGALLIVVGLCRTGIVQASLIPMGFVVLLVTSSRTSTVAGLAGASAVLLSALLWDRRRSLIQWTILSGVPFLLAAVALRSVQGGVAASGSGEEVARRVESAMGRSTIWPTYLQIWLESPWTGSPDRRIVLAAQRGDLPDWAATAHNLLLDALVRFGLIGSVVVVAALTVAGVMTVRAAAAGVRVGVGLLAVIVACGLTEALVSWLQWSASTIILFLAVIASIGPYPPARWRPSPSSEPETMNEVAASSSGARNRSGPGPETT
jgi:hypothetical protein